MTVHTADDGRPDIFVICPRWSEDAIGHFKAANGQLPARRSITTATRRIGARAVTYEPQQPEPGHFVPPAGPRLDKPYFRRCRSDAATLRITGRPSGGRSHRDHASMGRRCRGSVVRGASAMGNSSNDDQSESSAVSGWAASASCFSSQPSLPTGSRSCWR